ncbi:MAG: histidinol-phosphatase, partial [Planctomycetota bacterium]|jgi:DNA polymerase (family 10)
LRLDLDWRYIRLARDAGARFVISFDAHDPEDMDCAQLGVWIARKGWLGKADVLNCLTAAQFDRWLKGRRKRRSG